MHFARTGVTDHADQFAAGSSTHDGIVDQYDALSIEQMPDRIQLEFHAKIADRLRRLDECPAHIVAADQCLPEWNTGRRGESNGRCDTRIWHGHHHVRIHWRFFRKQPSKILARFLHGTAEYD